MPNAVVARLLWKGGLVDESDGLKFVVPARAIYDEKPI